MTDRGFMVEVYSDIVCPWCYVGKRRLERALAQLNGGAQARITWRPFQLNPTMPLDGMDRATYLKAKFGSLETLGRWKNNSSLPE
jgi:predicted DsbA family dithiol-disulfide isomerase